MSKADEGEVLTLAEAAERLDVHYMTVYRWVRTGLLDAWKEGGVWRVAATGLKAPTRRPPGRRPADATSATPERLEELVERLATVLLVGDEPGGWRLLEEAVAHGLPREQVHVGLIAPTMELIGARWEAGQIDVGDEHRATVVATRLIARAGPLFRRPGRRRGRVLVGTIEGERHGLPVAMLSDLLRDRSIDVVEVGTDAPALSYVALIDADRTTHDAVQCVALNATLPADPVIRTQVAVIRSARPGVPVLVGGAAVLSEEHARDLGASGWTGPTALDAVAAIEAVLVGDADDPDDEKAGATT